MLDRGSCRRKQVVRYPTRGYRADQPSLTHATRPPNLLALDDHIHISSELSRMLPLLSDLSWAASDVDAGGGHLLDAVVSWPRTESERHRRRSRLS